MAALEYRIKHEIYCLYLDYYLMTGDRKTVHGHSIVGVEWKHGAKQG